MIDYYYLVVFELILERLDRSEVHYNLDPVLGNLRGILIVIALFSSRSLRSPYATSYNHIIISLQLDTFITYD